MAVTIIKDLPSPKVKLDKTAVKKHVEEAYAKKRKTKDALRFKGLLLSALFYGIDPQLQGDGGFRIDVSDKTLADLLSISSKQASRVRSTLQELDIIFFPEWSRPRKPGDYPMWLVRYDYMTFHEPDKVKKTVANRKYKPLYYVLKDAAQKEVYAMLSEYDAVVSMRTYMMLVYKDLDQKLQELGIDKESLLR